MDKKLITILQSESLSIWAYFASIWLTGMVFHKQEIFKIFPELGFLQVIPIVIPILQAYG